MPRKESYNWNKVKPGDIISFRYKSNRTGTVVLNTILVLNPRLPIDRKDGTKGIQLIGLKSESANKPHLRINTRQVRLFEKIGNFEIIDEENDLYRLNIKESLIVNDIKGTNQRAYKLIAQTSEIKNSYRTYDYKKAKKSSVSLEPIRLFTDIKDDD